MLDIILSLHPLYLLATVLGSILVYFPIKKLHVDYRIRKLGGVRSGIIATNPISGIPFFIDAGLSQSSNQFLKFYNAIFRYGTPECPNTVEISSFGIGRFMFTRDPEHIKTILTTRFGEYGKGPLFHEIWKPFLGDSIFTTDKQKWSDSRAMIRPMFMKDRVRDLEIFEKWTAKLMSKLPPSGQTVDMMDLFYRMTLDVTTDFLLGHSVESLDNPTHQFVDAFQEVQRIQMMLTILSPFRAFIPKGRYHKGIRVLERFVEPYIARTLALTPEELEKLSKSDKDFSFLHMVARSTRDAKEIRDQLMAVLIAGRDTTAATLSWTIYELANYPATYRKLRDEVLATVGPSRAPTYEDLKSMTYLTHTLNETLRLYPAVPFNTRSALQDTRLPGKPGQPDIIVLEGDTVTYSTMAMQRRADLYPPVSEKFADPGLFSPDRWDHWTPKAWNYLPFNGGPRICVGQNFAMTEMALTLVRLLQKYGRLEYRGDWHAQYHKAEIVGAPGHGVPVAFFEAVDGDVA